MENIDFSAFSEDDFDPVRWLNDIFSTGEAGNGSTFPNKEMAATNLVYKLQLMVEETNHSLEEIAQRMAHSVPKVIGEAEVLGREAAELLTEVSDVRTKMLLAGQQSSEVAVDSLSQLDQAKQRLQETYKALQEANNWTTLTADVEEVFESGDTEQIASKLASMQKSLEVLSLSSSQQSTAQGAPLNDLKEKLATLEALKDRFEKLVEPVLVGAFLAGSSQNTSSSSTSSQKSIEFYSKLFRELHRSDRLLAAYHRCLRDQLLKEWSTTVRLDPEEETLLNWLNFLYDRLTVLWKTQMTYCMKVLYPENFGQSLKTLCDIYSDIVMSLDPTIEACLVAHLQRQQQLQQSAAPLHKNLARQNALIQLKQLTNAFMRTIETNILEQYSGAERANDFVPRVSSFDIFIRTIYRPLAAANETFIALERDRLNAEFEFYLAEDNEEGSNSGGGGSGGSGAAHRNIVSSECVINLFVAARGSLKLYGEFVQSYPILLVDQAIEPFLRRFFDQFRGALQENINRHLKKGSGGVSSLGGSPVTNTASSSHRRNNSASNNLTATGNNSNTGKLKSSSSSSSLAATVAAALSGSSTPNWQVIQQALFIFQIVGEFTLQLERLQQQVHSSLLNEHQKCTQEAVKAGNTTSVEAESSEVESKTSAHTTPTSIFYFNRFDIFILNLDSNIELRDQIEGYLQLPASSLNEGGRKGILGQVHSECVKAAQASGQAVLDAVLDFVNAHLSAFMATIRLQLQSSSGSGPGDLSAAHGLQRKFSSEEEDASEDSLSFSPTEYITQIGQYLLTLPQHLEPFNPNENAALKCALRHSVDVFTGGGVSTGGGVLTADQVERIENATTELLLDAILRHTTRAFLSHLLKLSSAAAKMSTTTTSTSNSQQQQTPTKSGRRALSASMRKQIAIDLSYLVAVCEDLGLTASSSTSTDHHSAQFALLVRVFNEVHSKEDFQQVVLQDGGNHGQMLQLLEEIMPF